MRKKVKRKKKTSFKQIKNKKSWFKLVQVGLFRYFFADLFPIFNYYYYLCDQISFKPRISNHLCLVLAII